MNSVLFLRALALGLVNDECKAWLLDEWDDRVAGGLTREAATKLLVRDAIVLRFGIDAASELDEISLDELFASPSLGPRLLPFTAHRASTLLCYGYQNGGEYDSSSVVLRDALAAKGGDLTYIFAETPSPVPREEFARLLNRLKMRPADSLVIVRTLRDFCIDGDVLLRLLEEFHLREISLISIAEDIDTTLPGGIDKALKALLAMRHYPPGPDDAVVGSIVERVLGDEHVRDITKS